MFFFKLMCFSQAFTLCINVRVPRKTLCGQNMNNFYLDRLIAIAAGTEWVSYSTRRVGFFFKQSS